MLKRDRGSRMRALSVAAGLALVVSAAPLSAQVPQKALECNSLINIAFGPATPVAGGSECDVTLTIENALSRDLFDVGVDQDFQMVDFFGSCTSVGPCVADPALPVTFVPGSESTTCMGMAVVTPGAGNGSVNFDFGMPGFNLGPAPGGVCPPGAQPCRCEITFRVFIADANAGIMFPTEATTAGVCNIPNFPVGTFTSAAAATAPITHNVTVVPTTGEAALLALAILLAVGAASMLRRRSGEPRGA